MVKLPKHNRHLYTALFSTCLIVTSATSVSADTFFFKFENGETFASATGTITTTATPSLTPSNSFNISYGTLTSLDVTVAGASSGNGQFSLSDFQSISFRSNGPIDFSANLVGQANFGDFNLFGVDAPAPVGSSPFVLAADFFNADRMTLTCFLLSGISDNCGFVVVPVYSINDAAPSLISTSIGLSSTVTSTNLLVNGAHSRPMSRYVDVKDKAFWVAGDFGTDKHGSRDGNIGLGEFGVGYNYGVLQLNAALGQTWANQNLIDNGAVDTDGYYLMVEGIIPINAEKGIYATIGAYNLWGDVDIKRGYVVGGSFETSSANVDSTSWGLRARVDWVDAFSYKSTHFSPYVDLFHSQSSIDGYTETGGAFPAQFDARDDEITELRIGLNSSTPINSTELNFIANLEAAHRFEEKAANTTGLIAGVGNFNIAGEEYKQNWMKAGIGVEGKVGEGNISLTLNGTTKSEKSDSWVAVSYTMAF